MHVLSCFLEFLNLCWQTKGRASLSRKQAETLLTSLRQLQVRKGSRGNDSDQHEIKVHLSPSTANVLSFPRPFSSSLTRTHRAPWAPLSSAQPLKLSVRTRPAGVTCCPADLWPPSVLLPVQGCSATGRQLSCCLSALLLEPCTCPSTALSHVSPGCADSLVTCALLRSLEWLKSKAICNFWSHFLTSALQLCMNRRPVGRWKTEGSTL